MDNKTYNGWSTYATWRIKLEMLDSWADYHMDGGEYERFDSVGALADHLKDYAEEQIENYIERGDGVNLARDYALAFLADVNWHEIAGSIAEDYPSLLESNHA